MNPAILAIDLGSSTVKAAVVDHSGALRGTGAGTIELMLGADGAAEQSPDQLWAAVMGACRQAIEASSAGAAEIVGVACSSQYSSVVPVDAAGAPAANLILWRDTRGAKHARALIEGNPDARAIWTEIHGLPPSPEGRDTLAHMLYVKHEAPDVYARVDAFLEPVDYLNLRFSGVTAANQCSVYKMLLTDNRQSNAREYDPTLMALAGIGADKLPPLIDVDAVVGGLRADVADELGLAAGIAVVGGVNDNHAVALATGALEKRRAGLSIGTTASISALVDGLKSEPAKRLAAMPSPLPGRNMVMAENGLGGKVLELVLRRLFFPEADAASDAPFDAVERAAARGAPGSGGVLFLPWINGAGSPASNARARAGFLNISPATTRDDMLSAVLEGIAFNLRWLNEAVEEFVDDRFERVMFVGGGAQSDAWSRILADVLDRPVHQLADARFAPCKGLAYRALVRLGHLGEDARDDFLRVRAVYHPRAEHRALYDAVYGQFLAAYENNISIFTALNG